MTKTQINRAMNKRSKMLIQKFYEWLQDYEEHHTITRNMAEHFKQEFTIK